MADAQLQTMCQQDEIQGPSLQLFWCIQSGMVSSQNGLLFNEGGSNWNSNPSVSSFLLAASAFPANTSAWGVQRQTNRGWHVKICLQFSLSSGTQPANVSLTWGKIVCHWKPPMPCSCDCPEACTLAADQSHAFVHCVNLLHNAPHAGRKCEFPQAPAEHTRGLVNAFVGCTQVCNACCALAGCRQIDCMQSGLLWIANEFHDKNHRVKV